MYDDVKKVAEYILEYQQKTKQEKVLVYQNKKSV